MAERGGSCKNPFGGDQPLWFIDFAELCDRPEKALLLSSISDAFCNYCYFGLGNNGTCADEFWFSVQYFFYIRADQPKSWKHARVFRDRFLNEDTGLLEDKIITLTDAELQFCCFDEQYSYLNIPMDFERFVSELRAKRHRILHNSEAQVRAYIDQIRAKEYRKTQSVRQSVTTIKRDLLDILELPLGGLELAKCLYGQPAQPKTIAAAA